MSNKDEIRELGETNPMIRLPLNLQMVGRVSYEQALEMMVIALASSNKLLMDDAIKIKLHGVPPMIVVTTQERADAFREQYESGKSARECVGDMYAPGGDE